MRRAWRALRDFWRDVMTLTFAPLCQCHLPPRMVDKNIALLWVSDGGVCGACGSKTGHWSGAGIGSRT